MRSSPSLETQDSDDQLHTLSRSRRYIATLQLIQGGSGHRMQVGMRADLGILGMGIGYLSKDRWFHTSSIPSIGAGCLRDILLI